MWWEMTFVCETEMRLIPAVTSGMQINLENICKKINSPATLVEVKFFPDLPEFQTDCGFV